MFNDLSGKSSSFHNLEPAAYIELCHHMSSEMSLECSRVFVKRSVVNVKWYDSVKVQNYKQVLNRSDLIPVY